MAKVVKGARFISKISNSIGVPPTIPANDDHTTGWKDTDIYVGEWFFNIADSKIYFRSEDGIHQIITIPSTGTTNGTIDTKYLPGNYLGAMLYIGTWDASTWNTSGRTYGPGYDLNRDPQNGDYYIVTNSGSADLNIIGTFVNYNTGDFVVYSNVGNSGWQKVDNSEPTIYSNNVLYSNTGITELLNADVEKALNIIFQDKFLVPVFDKTVNINSEDNISTNQLLRLNGNDVSGVTLLEINGNDTDKWVSFDGTTLNVGSYGSSSSVLQFGPKGLLNISSTNTVNFTYADTGLTHYNRWSIFSSASDGYIKGYANDGITPNILISITGNTFFSSNVSIGTNSLISGSVLQVNANDTISKLIISRSGSNLSTGTTSSVLSFYQSLAGTPTEYGNINLRTSTDYTYLTTMGFKVKSTSGTLLEGLTLRGTNNGTYVGINNLTPLYELDVNGSVSITDSLFVNSDISITGNTIYIDQLGSINYLGTNSTMISFQDILKIKWMNSDNLIFEGVGSSTLLTLNATTGLLTLGGLVHTVSGDTQIFRMNQDVRTDSDVSFNKVNLIEKITYLDTGITISDSRDVPNRKYVDDQINAHSNMGIWTTGYTNDLSNTDVVLSSSGLTYWTGINIFNPTYNLHVIGNAYISTTLNIGSTLTAGNAFLNNTQINGYLQVTGLLQVLNGSSIYNSGDTISNIDFGDVDGDTQAEISIVRGIDSDGTYTPTDVIIYNSPDGSIGKIERLRIKYDGETIMNSSLSINSTLSVEDNSGIYFQVNAIAINSQFIGINAGSGSTNSTNSNFIGYSAGMNSDSSVYTNYIGHGAGQDSPNVIYSNFIGFQTGKNSDSSSYSNFIGHQAGYNSSGSTHSNFIGDLAGLNSYNANFSNIIGYNTGIHATTSYSNLIGYNVANQGSTTNTIGNNNIIIGTNITLTGGTSNSINIGGVLFGSGTYSTTTGNPAISPSSNGKISIGINTQTLKFEVVDTDAVQSKVSGFYNSYNYVNGSKAESMIVLGRVSGTTLQDMGGISAYSTTNISATNGSLSLYTRRNNILTKQITIDENGYTAIGTTPVSGYKLYVNGATTINGNLIINNDLNNNGATTLYDTLTVQADSNLVYNLNVSGTTILYGVTNLHGITNFYNTTNLNSNLNITGTTILYGSLVATNFATFNNTTSFNNIVNINYNVPIGYENGDPIFSINNTATNESTFIINDYGNLSQTKDSFFYGTTTFNGNLISNSGVTFNNGAIFNSGMTFRNGIDLINSSYITTDGSILSYINFGHASSSVQSKIRVERSGSNSYLTNMIFSITNNTTNIVDVMTISNDSIVYMLGGLSVNSTSTLNNVNIGGTTTFSGISNFNDTVNLNSEVNFNGGVVIGEANAPSVSYNGYLPGIKAFGNISADGLTLYENYNISSITHSSPGDYTINLTNAISLQSTILATVHSTNVSLKPTIVAQITNSINYS